MVHVDRALRAEGLATRMILQIHDELLFEAPTPEVERASAVIRAQMEGVHPLRVPLPVELGVGPTWADAHALEPNVGSD